MKMQRFRSSATWFIGKVPTRYCNCFCKGLTFCLISKPSIHTELFCSHSLTPYLLYLNSSISNISSIPLYLIILLAKFSSSSGELSQLLPKQNFSQGNHRYYTRSGPMDQIQNLCDSILTSGTYRDATEMERQSTWEWSLQSLHFLWGLFITWSRRVWSPYP